MPTRYTATLLTCLAASSMLSSCTPRATSSEDVVTPSASSPLPPIPSATSSLTAEPTPTKPSATNTPPPITPIGALRLRALFPGVSEPNGHGGPDTTIAAGPDSLVLAMNSTAGIMDRSGTVLDMRSMEDFFYPLHSQGVGGGTDPRVIFDNATQRFFFVIAEFPEGSQCDPPCPGLLAIAVSKTASPDSLGAGDWHFFAVNRSVQTRTDGTTYTGYYGDFDNLSTSGDTLAVTWDVDSPAGWLGPGGQARFLPTGDLVQGNTGLTWLDIPSIPAHVALNLDGTNGFYLVNSTPGDFRIWLIQNVFSGPAVSSARPLTFSPSLNDPPDAPQPDGPPIDLLPGKAQAIYTSGSIWIADVIRKDFGSGIVSAIQWMHIDVTEWPKTRLLQSGILGADSVWYFAPAIIADSLGNFCMLYVTASEEEHLSVHYTGRLSADPQGMLRPSNTIIAPDVPYSRVINDRNRFVDYLGIALDPNDGSVWMLALSPIGGESSTTWVANIEWTVAADQ